MSAGAFVNAKYEANDGSIYPCRVQPETLAATIGGTANAAPAGAVDTTTGRIALSIGHRRRRPFAARYVTIRWTGAVPDGYATNGLVRIPILTLALFNTIVEGTTEAVYAGGSGICVGKTSE